MLTDTTCKNTRAADTVVKVTDSNGLYLEVRPNGRKAWRYRYRIAGKENLFAIGDYPSVTLKEARTARDEARALVKKGIHPSHQRRLDRLVRAGEMADTFESVAREWLLRNSDWSANYARQVKARLEGDVFPKIGRLPVKDVKPAHVLDLLNKVAVRSPTQAKLVQTWVGGVFRFAVSTLRRDDDPTWPLRRAVKTTQVRHHAKLKEKEIGPFLRAIDAAVGDMATRSAVSLMWLTACRTNEITAAKWSEFDLDAGLWTIPAERMKARQEHVIPLPSQAIELVRSLMPYSGTVAFVFPHRSDRKKHMSSEAIRDLFRRAGYAGKFTPHGVRGTFSTVANGARWDAEVIEIALAHKEKDATRAAYNAARLLPQRRELLQWWADLSDDMRRGGKVVTLARSA